MTEKDFQINLSGAETFRRLADSHEIDFWLGYLRGIRRHYHGELFGTDDEHALWMKLATNMHSDERRRYRGLGYQCGFDGTNVTDALKQLEPTDESTMAIVFLIQFAPRPWASCNCTKHIRRLLNRHGMPTGRESEQSQNLFPACRLRFTPT